MIIDFNKQNGGGGSGSGVTPEQVQAQIDSALTYYWDSANTESAITAAVSGKADAKIMVDFDKTPQSERAALYAELKALYDGGSGSSINKLYDFYKTVNTWQGQKIDYYTFSGNTLVFGQVVSPENVTDQVVYVQVMEIDSAGNVNVVTNAIGASGGGVTQEYVDSAVTILQNQLDTIDDVIPAAIVDLNERVDAISGSTPDLSPYWTSAQTESAISAATSGKADAANVEANTYMIFPRWNNQGIVTGQSSQRFTYGWVRLNGNTLAVPALQQNDLDFYAPTTPGTAGEILVSTGGRPVWSAVTMGGVSQEYVDSAITQVQDQLDTIDQVASAALVDLNEKKVESEDVKHMVKLTQAEYDQLSVKDPETFYIIVNSN